MLKRFFCFTMLFTNCAFSVEKEQVKEVLPQLETFVEEGMQLSHVPGVAVAIVSGNEVVYLKGFGLRDVVAKLPVTPETIFQLASVSKPITSTILAILVSQGKIGWESKIADLDPSFQLSDAWVTGHLTIKDLLSHRSGLPDHAGDLLEDLGYPKEEILNRLRFITPLAPFRDAYAYTNFGFSEAGFAVAKKLNTSWDALAQKSLYQPLKMDQTSSRFSDYIANENRAVTYAIKEGVPTELKPAREPDAQSPAGGVSASIQDVAKWLSLQLGKSDLVSKEALLATHTPAITTGVNQASGAPSFYALGWDVGFDDQARRHVKHSGGFSMGVRTQVALIPDENIAIAILTNGSPTGLPEAVSRAFFDLLFKGTIEKGLVEKANAMWLKYQVDPEISFNITPDMFQAALPLSSYEGVYDNDYFGTIHVVEEKGSLILQIGPKPKTFPLRHLTRDTFSFVTTGENSSGETAVLFTVDEKGKSRSLLIDAFNKFGMGTFQAK